MYGPLAWTVADRGDATARRSCLMVLFFGVLAVTLTAAVLTLQPAAGSASARGALPASVTAAVLQQHLLRLRLHEAAWVRDVDNPVSRHDWEVSVASVDRSLRALLVGDLGRDAAARQLTQAARLDLARYAAAVESRAWPQRNAPAASAVAGTASGEDSASAYLAVTRSAVTLASLARTKSAPAPAHAVVSRTAVQTIEMLWWATVLTLALLVVTSWATVSRLMARVRKAMRRLSSLRRAGPAPRQVTA